MTLLPTYEQDKETVKEVARVLKENIGNLRPIAGVIGTWEKSFEFIKQDTDRWLEEVGSLLGH